MILIIIGITILLLFIIRLSLCLPMFSSKKPKSVLGANKGRVPTMVIWGSGGHTTEMILLLKKLDTTKFSPIHCVLAESDKTSFNKIQASNLSFLQLDSTQWHKIIRSREVKQSWITTIYTTFISTLHAIILIAQIQPQLIICNGPGTCVPLCLVAFCFKCISFYDPIIVFVESFCRVQKLSFTGKILYYFVDRFIVQWPQLLDKYSRAEYLKDI